MYEFKRLKTPSDLDDQGIFQSFTVNPYKEMLVNQSQLDQLIAIGVTANSIPIGLGIFHKKPEENLAKFVSLYIDKQYRHQHIGSQILALLEIELLKEDFSYQYIFSVYPTSSPTSPFFEKMILNQHWEIKETIFGGKIPNNAKFHWLNKKLRIPRGFEFFKWKDLTAEDRVYILEKQKNGWYTKPFNPFEKESDIEYLNSLGLRYNGEIVGWQITHRILPDTIQFWCLFIDPSVQNTGIGMCLLAEAIRLQVEAYPPLIYGAFLFRQERVSKKPQWLNFFERKLLPYCSSILTVHEAIKQLRK